MHESDTSPPAAPQGERTTALAGRGSAPLARVALISANLVPLAGVMMFGWDLFSLLVLYWLENGVIGAFNLLKILLARGEMRVERLIGAHGVLGNPAQNDEPLQELENARVVSSVSRFFLAPFFLVHYGIFWAVHGVFVFAVFGGELGGMTRRGGSEVVDFSTILITLAALAISHGISFATNFIGHREYAQVSAPEQMFQPYGRVFVLHIAILGGGILIMLLGQPVAALILLILLKSGLDLRAHMAAHERRV
jgi:hypothetical protein